MKRALIAAAILAAVVLLGLLAYRHFVMNSIMDKDGMENPNAGIEMLDGPGAVFDGGKDLQTTWHSEGSADYTVEIGEGLLSLYAGGTLVCQKEYYAMTDGIFRLYPMDGEPFGEFSYFDYSINSLQGCIESDSEMPQYIAFGH